MVLCLPLSLYMPYFTSERSLSDSSAISLIMMCHLFTSLQNQLHLWTNLRQCICQSSLPSGDRCVVCYKRGRGEVRVFSYCSAPQCGGKYMHITKKRNCFKEFHDRLYHNMWIHCWRVNSLLVAKFIVGDQIHCCCCCYCLGLHLLWGVCANYQKSEQK